MPKWRGGWIGIWKGKGKENGQGKGELSDKGSLIKACIITIVNYFIELFSDISRFVSSVGAIGAFFTHVSSP